MTPQEFVETLDPPETLRHVAIVAPVPLYFVSQWMGAVRQHAGVKFDSYSFRINPIRLHGFIDGWPEPRLAVTFHDPMDLHLPPPTPQSSPSTIIITEISL